VLRRIEGLTRHLRGKYEDPEQLFRERHPIGENVTVQNYDGLLRLVVTTSCRDLQLIV